jgi:hypothetical protein
MTNKELHELAKKVGDQIGYIWYPGDNESREERDGLRASARIRSESGALYFAEITYGASKGRISIAVSWPSSAAMGWQVYHVAQSRRNGRTAEITVAGSKTPEQIAKDIKSRLLADAESLYQEARKEMQAAIDFRENRRVSVKQLANALGERVPERIDDEVSFWIDRGRYLGTAKLVGERDVNFSFTANIEQAAKVIEFIRSLKK